MPFLTAVVLAGTDLDWDNWANACSEGGRGRADAISMSVDY